MEPWHVLVGRIPFEAQRIASGILREPRKPDLVIAPDGSPYLLRWHLVKSRVANVYLHLQVASDPERPLHDHPWDNQSVILAGGYLEVLCQDNGSAGGPAIPIISSFRKAGDVISRKAAEPHRLVLANKAGLPQYALTLFTSGPKIREWGFWYPEGWVPNYDVVRTENGVSR